jgi:hypothetical protein
MSSRVAEAIRPRVAAHQAPGVVGITDPQMMADSGVPWTSAQIELWRDQELAWLDRVLLEAPGRDPDQAARIGLALADVRVRDVTLALSVRQEHTEAVAAALWPVAASLPQPRWSAPTGSVLALCEWINGRDPIRVLDLTAPGLGYPLADLTGARTRPGPARSRCAPGPWVNRWTPTATAARTGTSPTRARAMS